MRAQSLRENHRLSNPSLSLSGGDKTPVKTILQSHVKILKLSVLCLDLPRPSLVSTHTADDFTLKSENSQIRSNPNQHVLIFCPLSNPDKARDTIVNSVSGS